MEKIETVADLIKALQACPANANILIHDENKALWHPALIHHKGLNAVEITADN